MIRFFCEECGVAIRVPQGQAEAPATCPRCAAPLLADPDAGGGEELPRPLAAGPVAVGPPAGGPGGHVLVVEDDCHIQGVMTTVLEWEGFRVGWARDGQEALDYLRGADLPHLILLDLMMGRKSGWEFRGEQRQDPRLAAIPVVLVSAAGNLEQEAVTLAAAAFLAKPVELNELLATIRRYCSSPPAGVK